jgi:hypothetical protein
VPAGESGPVVRVVEGGEQPGSQEIAADLVAGDVLRACLMWRVRSSARLV